MDDIPLTEMELQKYFECSDEHLNSLELPELNRIWPIMQKKEEEGKFFLLTKISSFSLITITDREKTFGKTGKRTSQAGTINCYGHFKEKGTGRKNRKTDQHIRSLSRIQ